MVAGTVSTQFPAATQDDEVCVDGRCGPWILLPEVSASRVDTVAIQVPDRSLGYLALVDRNILLTAMPVQYSLFFLDQDRWTLLHR